MVADMVYTMLMQVIHGVGVGLKVNHIKNVIVPYTKKKDLSEL